MFEKQKITEILPAKSGIGKNGKPYAFYKIKTDRMGDKILTTFANATTSSWQVGDEIEIKVTETKSPDGKFTNYNFEVPRKGAIDGSKIEELLNGQLTIKLYLRKIMRALKIDDEFSDVEKAREVYNSTQKPVSDGYTSKGYDGESPIKTADVNFVPKTVYPDEYINSDDIPF